LEFLLKGESRHENGAADQKQPEHQNNVENFLAREIGQRVGRDRENSRQRESAMQSITHSIEEESAKYAK
jgi:hypothetical protein